MRLILLFGTVVAAATTSTTSSQTTSSSSATSRTSSSSPRVSTSTRTSTSYDSTASTISSTTLTTSTTTTSTSQASSSSTVISSSSSTLVTITSSSTVPGSSSSSTATSSSSATSSTATSSSSATSSTATSSSSATSSTATSSSSATSSTTVAASQQASGVPNSSSDSSNCIRAARYSNATSADWTRRDVDSWLAKWNSTHTSDISKNQLGFAGAFRAWALGQNGTNNSNASSLNTCIRSSDDIEMSAYILRSLQQLEAGISSLQKFGADTIKIANGEYAFPYNFYADHNERGLPAARSAVGVSITALQLIAAQLFGPSKGASALMSLAGEDPNEDAERPMTMPGVMYYLAKHVTETAKIFASAGKSLMSGQLVNGTANVASLMANGSLLSSAPDAQKLSQQVNTYLTAKAINALWRGQKVFIMGGGKCGDGEGMGSGPQHRKVCRDGKAWYLYWWQEQSGFTVVASHRWGWVEDAPRASQLGTGAFANITVQDVINSSLDSYIAGGFNYTDAMMIEKARSGFNVLQRGSSSEGVFNIPVCDIGKMKDKKLYGKQYLLENYGGDHRPMWCGAICDLNPQLTKDFINAANMGGFQSPTYQCDTDNFCRYWTAPGNTRWEYCNRDYNKGAPRVNY